MYDVFAPALCHPPGHDDPECDASPCTDCGGCTCYQDPEWER